MTNLVYIFGKTVQLGNEDQPTKENESHNCKFCGSPKNSPEDVIKHCFAEHNYCLECEKKFQSLSDAVDHMNSIHVTRLKCYLCNFSTLDHTQLKAHEESHGTSQVKTYSRKNNGVHKSTQQETNILKDVKYGYLINY